MKRVLVSLFLGITVMMVSCTGCFRQQRGWNDDYQVLTGPGGQQMVNYNGYLMDYLLFQQLMNSGGMSGVRNYYNLHQSTMPRYNQQTYGNWKSTPSSSFRNTYKPQTGGSGFRDTYKPSTTTGSSPSSNYHSTPSTPSYRSSTSGSSSSSSPSYHSSSPSGSSSSSHSSGSSYHSSGRH